MQAAARCSIVSGTMAAHVDIPASAKARPASSLRRSGVVIEHDSTTFARLAVQAKLPQGTGTGLFLPPSLINPVDSATPQTMMNAHISIQVVISSPRKMAP